jgi:DNA-binding MarR family transcriptional regulator
LTTTTRRRVPDACAVVIDEHGLSAWSPTHSDAWIGLLEAHKALTRELDAELEAAHGLSISSLELLSRLAVAEERSLRLSTLADRCGLSLSRVSRIVDVLQHRGLVQRRPCPVDRRAKNACLTDAGLDLLRTAQETHFTGVQQRFFDRLQPREIATLAAVFARFAG